MEGLGERGCGMILDFTKPVSLVSKGGGAGREAQEVTLPCGPSGSSQAAGMQRAGYHQAAQGEEFVNKTKQEAFK